MSNTIIQIKRSDANSQPANLSAGEFAYSYLSNTLFLGTASGTGVINVGGLLYTQTIDAATAANTANTLVKRRSDGAFFGQLFGNANTATALQTGRYIGINQGAIAGQTIFHTHMHLIPRRKGDVENPTGGVRNVIPGKGEY